MIALLQQIVDDFVCWIETGVVLFANLILTALGAVVSALIALLPSMPSLPSIPSWFHTGYNYVAYWFPVDWALGLGATMLSLWLGWVAVAIVLRWARAVGGKA